MLNQTPPFYIFKPCVRLVLFCHDRCSYDYYWLLLLFMLLWIIHGCEPFILQVSNGAANGNRRPLYSNDTQSPQLGEVMFLDSRLNLIHKTFFPSNANVYAIFTFFISVWNPYLDVRTLERLLRKVWTLCSSFTLFTEFATNWGSVYFLTSQKIFILHSVGYNSVFNFKCSRSYSTWTNARALWKTWKRMKWRCSSTNSAPFSRK